MPVTLLGPRPVRGVARERQRHEHLGTSLEELERRALDAQVLNTQSKVPIPHSAPRGLAQSVSLPSLQSSASTTASGATIPHYAAPTIGDGNSSGVVGSRMRWASLAGNGQAASALQRSDMTMSTLGWGKHARLILFGGWTDSGLGGLGVLRCEADLLHGGVQLALENHGETPVLSESQRAAASTRYGHATGNITRHTVVLFGGLDAAGQLVDTEDCCRLLSLHSHAPPPPLGMHWQPMSAAEARAAEGTMTELLCPPLAAALKRHRLSFSEAELAAFNHEVRPSSFVRSGERYWRPVSPSGLALTWMSPPPGAYGTQPAGRAHHGMASLRGMVLMFGGLVRVSDRQIVDGLRRQLVDDRMLDQGMDVRHGDEAVLLPRVTHRRELRTAQGPRAQHAADGGRASSAPRQEPCGELWQMSGVEHSSATSAAAHPQLRWSRPSATGAPPPPRSHCIFEGVEARQLALLFGGRSFAEVGEVVLNDAYVLAIGAHRRQSTWTQLLTCGVPPSPRAACAATTVGSSVLIFGGEDAESLADMVLFHLSPGAHALTLAALPKEAIGTWEHVHSQPSALGPPARGRDPPLAEMWPTARHGHGLVMLGSLAGVLLAGGRASQGEQPAPALSVPSDLQPRVPASMEESIKMRNRRPAAPAASISSAAGLLARPATVSGARPSATVASSQAQRPATRDSARSFALPESLASAQLELTDVKACFHAREYPYLVASMDPSIVAAPKISAPAKSAHRILARARAESDARVAGAWRRDSESPVMWSQEAVCGLERIVRASASFESPDPAPTANAHHVVLRLTGRFEVAGPLVVVFELPVQLPDMPSTAAGKGTAGTEEQLLRDLSDEASECQILMPPRAVEDAVADEEEGDVPTLTRLECAVPLAEISRRLPGGGMLLVSVRDPSGRQTSALPFAFMLRSIDETMLLLRECEDEDIEVTGVGASTQSDTAWKYARRRQVQGTPSITAASAWLLRAGGRALLRLRLLVFDEKGNQQREGGLQLSVTLHEATTGDVCSSAEIEQQTRVADVECRLDDRNDGSYFLHAECPAPSSPSTPQLYTLVLRLDGIRLMDIPVTLRLLSDSVVRHPSVGRRRGCAALLHADEVTRLQHALQKLRPVALLRANSRAAAAARDEKASLQSIQPSNSSCLVLRLGTAHIAATATVPPSSSTVIDDDENDDDGGGLASTAMAAQVHYSTHGEAIEAAAAEAAFRTLDLDRVSGELVTAKSTRPGFPDPLGTLHAAGDEVSLGATSTRATMSGLERRIEWRNEWLPAVSLGVHRVGDSFEVEVVEPSSTTAARSASIPVPHVNGAPSLTFSVTPTTFKFVPEPELRVRTLMPPMRVGTLYAGGGDGLYELRVDNSTERFWIDAHPETVSLACATQLEAGSRLLILHEGTLHGAIVQQPMPRAGRHRLMLVSGGGNESDEEVDEGGKVVELHLNEFNHCETGLDVADYLRNARQLCESLVAEFGKYTDAATGMMRDIDCAISMDLREEHSDHVVNAAAASSQALNGLDSLSTLLLDPQELENPRQLDPLLIAAGPGKGKSIFLQKLAHRIARRGCGLDMIEGTIEELPASPLLPFLVPASLVADAVTAAAATASATIVGPTMRATGPGVERMFVRQTTADQICNALVETLRRQHDQARALLCACRMRRVVMLIDDLHKVAAHDHEALTHALYTMQEAGLLTIAVSRSESVDQSLLHRFRLLTLSELTEEQQRRIVHLCLQQHSGQRAEDTARLNNLGVHAFFEHVVQFTALRNGHDRLYTSLFAEPQRQAVERARARDRFVRRDGSFDPSLCLQYRSSASARERVVEPLAPGAPLQSQFLSNLQKLLKSSRRNMLQELDDMHKLHDADKLASLLIDDKAYPRHEAFPEHEAKALRRVLSRLTKLVNLEAHPSPPERSQPAGLRTPSPPALQRRFIGPPSKLWQTICQRTDELYRVNERLEPVAQRLFSQLIYDFKTSSNSDGGTIDFSGIAPLKDPVRVHEKAIVDYGDRFDHLPESCVLDVLRCRLTISDSATLVAVMNRLATLRGEEWHLGLEVARVAKLTTLRMKNKFNPLHLDPAHFRNVLFNFKLEVVDPVGLGWTFVEVQLHHERILEHNEEGHAHESYEFFRSAL